MTRRPQKRAKSSRPLRKSRKTRLFGRSGSAAGKKPTKSKAGAVAPRTAIAPDAGRPARTIRRATTARQAGVPAPSGTYSPAYRVYFDALTAGGFYSSDPDDLKVRRSVRTNNPGALNISSWQRSRPGYVAVTRPDGSGNRTAIYRTPEHGVASWYVLIADRYGFGTAGSFTVEQLAERYAGTPAGSSQVNQYLSGWKRWSGGRLLPTVVIGVADDSDMLMLAKAMYAHEAAQVSPLHDDQILFGIQNQRAGILPA
jgi:D-alanyl-D-alanine carboxypeptidase